MTGLAFQGFDDRWISAAKVPLAFGVRDHSPSMPAVMRPLLCCVTRFTLTSVLLRLRSMSFWKLRTFFGPPSCVALKILCLSRRTFSSQVAQSMPCQSSKSSWGPFTAGEGVTAGAVISMFASGV